MSGIVCEVCRGFYGVMGFIGGFGRRLRMGWGGRFGVESLNREGFLVGMIEAARETERGNHHC